MLPIRMNSWLPMAVLLASIGAILSWLLLGFAAPKGDFSRLRDVPGVRLEFLETSDQLSVEKIDQFPASAWLPLKENRNRVFTSPGEVLWVRFTLPNRSAEPLRGILVNADYFVDKVELFVRKHPAKGFEYQITGESIPMENRFEWGRDLTLSLEIPANGAAQVYVRVEDFYVSSLQLTWWPDQRQFVSFQAHGLLAEGIYFGVLLALLSYNAFLWLRLKLSDIGYYVLYLASAACFMALSRGLPGLVGWTLASPWLELFTAIAMLGSGFSLIQFARVFLDLKKLLPRADLSARILSGLLFLTALGTLTGEIFPEIYWLRVSVVMLIVVHLSLVITVFYSWRSGSRQARFFTAAFGCLFTATLPVMAYWFGDELFGSAPMMYLMIGSALEMLLLSLATADRFVQAQRENVSTQEKLLEETEQRRAIQEAYADELAVEVRERTRELEEANVDKDRMITVLGHDLRGPLTNLTQTAEQLTSAPANLARLEKFAVDSAQTGRETLLLIEDLVLWARLRNGDAHPASKHQVRALVAPVIALHQAFAGQRGIELVVNVPEDLKVSTDFVLAQTLLRNLVANALKFARTRVEVAVTETNAGVKLLVRDDGPGLPAAVITALATDTAAPVNAVGGLGLRLCAEISRSLGTKLEVNSEAGVGTEFRFGLAKAKSDSKPPL